MTKTQLLRLHFRSFYLHSIDRARDLLDLVVPIFVVSGVLVGCFKFWIWLLP